ncbi:MAG: vitamin B12 dependent-methionine synthase activation domain-containing protein [Candidatus Bathyarchaeia archaeon]
MTLLNVNLKLSREDVLNFKSIGRIADKVRNLDSLIEDCNSLIKPTLLYEYVKVEEVKFEGVLLRGNIMFISSKLSEQLKCVGEIAAYIITIGPDLERRVTELSSNRILDSWILDNLGTYSLRLLSKTLEDMIRMEKGWRVLSRFNPGSTPTWELCQQEALFKIFSKRRVEEEVGVRLTENFVMIPRKSSSGIIAHTESKYHNCQDCRKICEHRQAPYVEAA